MQLNPFAWRAALGRRLRPARGRTRIEPIVGTTSDRVVLSVPARANVPAASYFMTSDMARGVAADLLAAADRLDRRPVTASGSES